MSMAARGALRWIVVASLAALVSCSRPGGVTMKDADFDSVDYPTYSRSSCSPEIQKDFVGLLLNAPRQVRLSQSEQLPVCGAYRLPHSVLKTFPGSPIEAVVLNFVGQGRGRLISFNLKPDKTPLEAPKTPEQPAAPSASGTAPPMAADYMVTGYFNVDALLFNPQFPREPANYVVYGVLGTYKSNVLEIRVSP